MPLNLNQIHQQIVRLLPPLNDLLIKNFYEGVEIIEKTGSQPSISVVTHLDKQVETILHEKLTKILPSAGFIGEETPLATQSEFNWVIDPIDGTLNFGSHIPVFAISIALWQKNEPIYSLTSLPMQQETIHAIKGKGLFLNNLKQPIINKKFIKPVVIYSCVGGRELINRVIDSLTAVCPSPPRAYGSCVFHGAQIALRRIDAGVFIKQALWDIGAITILAKEAGLTCQFVSPPPDLIKDDLKKYQYSLVLGPQKLVKKLSLKLK